jgi:hypothetical protein
MQVIHPQIWYSLQALDGIQQFIEELYVHVSFLCDLSEFKVPMDSNSDPISIRILGRCHPHLYWNIFVLRRQVTTLDSHLTKRY